MAAHPQAHPVAAGGAGGLALGASRGRLLRLIFAECVVLAGAGGILGAALAAAGLALIKRLMTIDSQGVFRIVFGESVLPRASEVGLDIRLVVMAWLVTGIATLAFGLLPAVRLSRTNHLEAMGSRGAGAARTGHARAECSRDRASGDGDDAARRRRAARHQLRQARRGGQGL